MTADDDGKDRNSFQANPFSAESPCINVCVISPAKICQGCFRSLDEIGRWTRLSDAQRMKVNAEAAKRKRDADASR